MLAKKLYPELDRDGFFYTCGDYQPIIDSIGNVLLEVHDSDYQGDSRILYEKNGKYGYLIFGWGSCSGCDALQSCDSYDEIDELIDGLVESVKWFDSLEELKEYFRNKDWELEYSWHAIETRDFVTKVLEYKILDEFE